MNNLGVTLNKKQELIANGCPHCGKYLAPQQLDELECYKCGKEFNVDNIKKQWLYMHLVCKYRTVYDDSC